MSRCVLFAGLALLLSPGARRLAAQEPPEREFVIESETFLGIQWTRHPKFNGRLLLSVENSLSALPIVCTADSDGRLDTFGFTLPDGLIETLMDYAIAPNGEIALIGGGYTRDGKLNTFIARIPADHKRQVVTPVWPYASLTVTFAPDESIWTIGRLKDQENTTVVAEPVLRRWDREGKLLGSIKLTVRGRNPIKASRITASNDRVAWFTRGGEYIEFSLDGKEIARFAAPEDVNGFAISPDNEVVAGRFTEDENEVLFLDRPSRRWIPAVLPEAEQSRWQLVLGFDGKTLVTYNNGTLRRMRLR